MQNVPGLDPGASALDRLKHFTGMLLKVPKAEADKENKPSGPTKRVNRCKAK